LNDNKLPKWPFISTGVIIVVIALVAVLGRQMNAVPNLRIPTPVMPSPNAYDFYAKAGNAIRDKDKIGYAISDDPHPPRPNPLPGTTPWLDRDYSLAEKAAIVQANSLALNTLRQGFSCEYLNPPCRSFNAMFPHFARDRELARLLVLESQVKAGHGDWGGAMDSCIDALRMGQDLPRGGSLISALVGVAMQSIGRKSAWKLVDKLDAGDSRSAVLRMEGIMARQVSFADTMQEEKWSTQAGMIEMFQQPRWRLYVFSGRGSTPSTLDRIVETARSVTWNKRRSLRCYSSFMDECIKNGRLPYAAAPKPGPSVPNEPICEILCPVYDKARITATKAETQNALLTITLALHAYRLEHGQYPAALADLKSSYLKKIPEDPFALKGPPKYKLLGRKYALYSVGPDSKDDGGKPIYDKSQAPRPGAPPSQRQRAFQVLPDSKGDIVAGVNVQ
jgi:hypothetical protein